MSGQHEMPTASVVRSSQATPARHRGHLCTASTWQSSTYRRPIRVQTNGATSLFSLKEVVEARNEVIDHCGTTVDAIIDFSEPQLLERALAIDGRIHKPTDYIETHYEQDGLRAVPFRLDEQAMSFRSRPAGKPVFNKLANLVDACTGQTIYVDFGGITVISSSFADEVFGKLFVALGPMRFMQSIRLINVSSTVQALVDRAITQRMQSPASGTDE